MTNCGTSVWLNRTFSGPCSIDQISEELVKNYMEDQEPLMEHIEDLLQTALEDFAEEGEEGKDQAARDATVIMRSCITENTRAGHIR